MKFDANGPRSARSGQSSRAGLGVTPSAYRRQHADDAVVAVAELVASQHRAFTRLRAADLNFDRSRVAAAKRAGWLEEPLPGVLVIVGSEEHWHQRLMAATLAQAGHAVASHRSAARLHGLDGFDDCDIVEVSVTNRHRWRLKADVVAHYVAARRQRRRHCRRHPLHRGWQGHWPISVRSLSDDGAAGAHRCTPSGRQPAVDPTHGRTVAPPRPVGTGALLRQLAHLPFEGRVPDSWFEELLALCLDDAESPPIVLQYPIRGETGRMSPRPTSASRRSASAWRRTAAGTTSAPTPSRSMSNAISLPRPAVENSSTSVGTPPAVPPKCSPSSNASSPPGGAKCDRYAVTAPRIGQSSRAAGAVLCGRASRTSRW